MFKFSGNTADELYADACWKFISRAEPEESRNGNVLTLQMPSVLRLRNPAMRILYNSDRDANPFFHLMESIWMWAGRDDVAWIEQFNKGIAQFAEPDGHFHGAYGWRWRNLFEFDQLLELAVNITKDPYSRQHVLQMWTGDYDASSSYKDTPCNTQIMFRVVDNKLNMTVINRSNDLVWGALGANIVHMTMLQELMARSTGLELGTYYVMSNNLHLYERHWQLIEEGKREADVWAYDKELPRPRPLDTQTIQLNQWLHDAEQFCDGGILFRHPWFGDVALPMKQAYLDKSRRKLHIAKIKCPAWRKAAELWSARRGV